jgi:hypothetical protein
MLCGRRPLHGRALSHSLDAEEINGGDPQSGEAAVYAASRHRAAGRLDEKSAALTSSVSMDYQPKLSGHQNRIKRRASEVVSSRAAARGRLRQSNARIAQPDNATRC